MDSNTQPSGKRKWRNLLLVPREQLTVVLMIFMIGFIVISVFFALVVWKTTELIYRLAELSEVSQAIVGMVPQTTYMLWASYFLILLIFATSSLLIGLVITHRYLGPTVAIRAHLRRLIEGNLETNLSLRKGDVLQEIANDLNELTRKLRRENPSSGAVQPD
jgi:sensor histidine kinase YesM